MSEDVKSVGFCGVLVTPISDDDQDEVSESMYDAGVLRLSYSGDVVYTETRAEIYGCDLINPWNDQASDGTPGTAANFIERCEAQGFPVVPTSVRQYSAVWYNGSDSPMSDFTAETLYEVV